ncbi:MAG: LicD family protein [Lachnospiraceae bacterium]|nr:LicD family protein [Lachnospiraceae bacterium]
MSVRLFEDEFYHKEERCGFVVSEVMKHCWAADMLILEELKAICAGHGLKFFAAYGTLLGAIRHGGYIPWDDDIDIGMVRDDYIALTELLENSDKYNILNPYTRSWYDMNFSHVTNNNDICFKREYLKKWEGCPFLTGPDIYPYYYIPRDPAEEAYILALLERIDNAISLSKQSDALKERSGSFNAGNSINERLAMSLVELEKETGYTFNTDRPVQNQLEILYDQVCRITVREDADYLARYDEYTKDRSKKFPREYLENVIEVPFEHISIPVPAGYAAVLNARFGNSYLTPSVERGAHDYPYYRKQMGSIGNKLEQAILEAYSDKRIKKEYVPEGGDKRSLIYYTSVRDMIINSGRAIEKITEMLDSFGKIKDRYRIYWIQGEFPANEDLAFDEMMPDMMDEYEKLKEKAEAVAVSVYGESDLIDKIAEDAEIFIGDVSLISEEFEKKQKKVFIQDYDAGEDPLFERLS